MKRLESLVDYINSLLNSTDLNYFIAGGSCIDVLQGGEIQNCNDIDIFFETQDDYITFETQILKHNDYKRLGVSPNASTYKCNKYSSVGLPLIQLIRNIGTVESIFSEFDLNKSQICITSDYKVHTGLLYNKPLQINFANFRSGTVARFMKYHRSKGFHIENRFIEACMDFLIDNPDISLTDYYDSEKTISPPDKVNYFFAKLDRELSDKQFKEIQKLYPEFFI